MSGGLNGDPFYLIACKGLATPSDRFEVEHFLSHPAPPARLTNAPFNENKNRTNEKVRIMIRFAPKTLQDAAPSIKIAKPNASPRSEIELSDTSSATAEKEIDGIEAQAATTIPGPAKPAAKLLVLSAELPPKGRKTGTRKGKEAASPKQREIRSGGNDHNGGDLLLDL